MSNRQLSIILPLAIRDTYTYRVPDSMPCPRPGTRVLVPLAKREMVGIVLGPYNGEPLPEDKLRDIIEVLDAEPILTEEQLRLWQWVADYYMCPIGDVMLAALPNKANDRQYVLADTSRRRVKLPEYKGETYPPHPLDDQQNEALQRIRQEWQRHDVVLLHGVTSSGKTEVYIHLIVEALERGQQVLYLVPEIALTTQLTDRLQRVFGSRLSVYHSRISDAQRMELYRQLILTNEPRLIVGARSAVFLPLRNAGLLIVDEEHEPSYKQQDPAPRYHARSLAAVRARLLGAKVLFGTATPSIETYYNALTGKYGLVEMKRRFLGLQLPRITLIDLQRQYHRKEMYQHFSDPLVMRIREELSKHKQIILFQNRRGYAPYVQCTACGYVPKCPDCDVSLTLHKAATYDARCSRLVCHYCGSTTPLPTVCPECGGEMRIHGFGTERIEDEVYALFPEARVARMDLDTTRRKDDYQSILSAFAAHEVDILIGTQMVTKGLHFDNVSLVAVLNADSLLTQPTFRSYERAYHMLEQVSGRAGRTRTEEADSAEVFIQTFDPKHPVFDWVIRHDYEAMYSEQIAERESFRYPPFTRLITITLRHRHDETVERAAQTLRDRLKAVFGQRCSDVILPSISRVQTKHIRCLQLRIEANASIARAKAMLRPYLEALTSEAAFRTVEILPDIDPQ